MGLGRIMSPGEKAQMESEDIDWMLSSQSVKGSRDSWCGCGIRKMIHRKWSLLTGPMVILGGIVGAVVVADILFIENHPYFKREQRKPDGASSDK